MRYKKKKRHVMISRGRQSATLSSRTSCVPIQLLHIHPSIHRHKHTSLIYVSVAFRWSQTLHKPILRWQIKLLETQDTEAHLICNFILTSVCLVKGVHAGEIDSQCLEGSRQAEPALRALYPHAGDSGAAILPLSAHFTTRHPQTPLRTLKKGSRCV